MYTCKKNITIRCVCVCLYLQGLIQKWGGGGIGIHSTHNWQCNDLIFIVYTSAFSFAV